jgi:hypothetical protein
MIKTEKNTVNSNRFRQVEFSDIANFWKKMKMKTLRKKTLSDIILFKSYLVNTGENTEIEKMTAENLNEKFSTFLLSVTKKDRTEYKPSTLRGFMCSLDRYLRQRNSNINVNSGPEFSKCRTVLKSKQNQLKALGYGNQPNASDEITDSDIEKLFDHVCWGYIHH